MSNVNRKYSAKVVCLYCEESGAKKTEFIRKNLDGHTATVHGRDVKVRFRGHSSGSGTMLNYVTKPGKKNKHKIK